MSGTRDSTPFTFSCPTWAAIPFVHPWSPGGIKGGILRVFFFFFFKKIYIPVQPNEETPVDSHMNGESESKNKLRVLECPPLHKVHKTTPCFRGLRVTLKGIVSLTSRQKWPLFVLRHERGAYLGPQPTPSISSSRVNSGRGLDRGGA